MMQISKWVNGCCSLLMALLLAACTAKNLHPSVHYHYPANRFYNGFYNLYGAVTADLTVTETEHIVQMHIHLNGLSNTDVFPVQIYGIDSSRPYGYSALPVIDLGLLDREHPDQTMTLPGLSYDSFIRDFKGYLIVHDPSHLSEDTTSFLIYGKTGAAPF